MAAAGRNNSSQPTETKHKTKTLSSDVNPNTSTTSSPIAIPIPSRLSGSGHSTRIPPFKTSNQQLINRETSALSSSNQKSGVLSTSVLEHSLQKASGEVNSASPKSTSLPQKVFNMLKGRRFSPSTGSPGVPQIAGSPSPATSRPNSARSRTPHSSESSAPGSAREQTETKQELFDFVVNLSSQSRSVEIDIDIDVDSRPNDSAEVGSPPENRPLESLVKHFEDASIQVDRLQTKSTFMTDEVSRTSSETSGGAQSKVSDLTTNSPVNEEAQTNLPQNEEGSSSNSSLIPGHVDRRDDQGIGSSLNESQQCFPRMEWNVSYFLISYTLECTYNNNIFIFK